MPYCAALLNIELVQGGPAACVCGGISGVTSCFTTSRACWKRMSSSKRSLTRPTPASQTRNQQREEAGSHQPCFLLALHPNASLKYYKMFFRKSVVNTTDFWLSGGSISGWHHCCSGVPAGYWRRSINPLNGYVSLPYSIDDSDSRIQYLIYVLVIKRISFLQYEYGNWIYSDDICCAYFTVFGIFLRIDCKLTSKRLLGSLWVFYTEFG